MNAIPELKKVEGLTMALLSSNRKTIQVYNLKQLNEHMSVKEACDIVENAESIKGLIYYTPSLHVMVLSSSSIKEMFKQKFDSYMLMVNIYRDTFTQYELDIISEETIFA